MKITFKRIASYKKWLMMSALLTPVFLTISYPNFNLHFISWIALIPLLLTIKRIRWFYAFLFAWGVGSLSFMGIFFWIMKVEKFSIPYYLLCGLYLGVFFGFFGLLTPILSHKSLLYPIYSSALWISLEYLRSHLSFLSLPWALLGHSQYKNLYLIQISSFTGVYGISFLIVLVNVSLGELLERAYLYFAKKEKKALSRLSLYLYLSPLLIVALILYSGKYYVNKIQKNIYNNTIRLGLIQGNVPQEIKWGEENLVSTLDLYESLTKEAAKMKPHLIIWPETSIPIDLHSVPSHRWRIMRLARQINIPLICGAAGSVKIGGTGDKNKKIYNSAFYISSKGQKAGEYRKIKLLPFGEFIPSIGTFSLKSIFPELKSNFTSGKVVKTFSLEGESFGITICWENIFPDLFRKNVLKGATFMVNISNDAWFKDSAGPYQHLMCNIFRAVENRISIARAANTGISCFIDPFGNIIKKISNSGGLDLNVRGICYGDIPIFRRQTFYTKHGDVFSFLCITFTCTFILFKTVTKIGIKRL